MIVLGIDPGTIAMGYGVIKSSRHEIALVACGALTAPRSATISERLHQLYSGLQKIIARYQPEVIAIEQPFVAKNAKSALAIGKAQAIAMLAAASQSIPVHEYSPTHIKRRVSNYGGSSKEQIQEMVKIQLGLPQVPQPSDAADALAVALCHLSEDHLNKLLTK